jgi:type I restriction enzyme S subunit
MIYANGSIESVAKVLPGFAFKSEHLGEVGIPVLKIGNIEDSGGVELHDAQRLPDNYFEPKYEKFRLHEGDILLAMTGATAGKAGRIRSANGSTFLLNQRVARLIPERIDPNYFWHVVSSNQYRERFFGLGGGAAQPNMSGPQIASVMIPIPPEPVQKKIGNILSIHDDLIENNRRRIVLLEEAARLLYREWFIHFRFPGHEHVKIIDGQPEGWEQRRLGDIAVTNRESYQAKNLPLAINYIDISSVTERRIISKTSLPATEAPGRARRKIQDGDIIWSNVRPNLRAYALILEPEEIDVVSTGFTVLTASSVPFSWLYMFTTTDSFIGYLVNHATGAGYPAVRPEDFERAEILLPPKILLNYFHERTAPNFRLIKKLDQQNQKLAHARDLLLPRLMNGEIAV